MKRGYHRAGSKGGIRTAFVFLLVAFLILFAAASLLANIDRNTPTITANAVGDMKSETLTISNSNTIRVPDSNKPVPNENEGTIVLWTKPPIEIFDQFSDSRDYIIFYTSTNVPGMRIVYNIKESRFEAGTPLLKSKEIDIFDGANHHIVYTFKKGDKQALIIDGTVVDSSDFRPMQISQVTGFAAKVLAVPEVDISGIEIAAYDRYVTADDIESLLR